MEQDDFFIMKDRAKLKGITYKARTVRPKPIKPDCYGQPDCTCMHCQQSRGEVHIYWQHEQETYAE